MPKEWYELMILACLDHKEYEVLLQSQAAECWPKSVR